MKKISAFQFLLSCMLLTALCLQQSGVYAQACVNADFSQGNYTGWTGTYTLNICSDLENGKCKCSPINPYLNPGFNQGPNDDPANDAVNEWNQIITTRASGNDPLITSLGSTMPMVYPGGGSTYSARIGNMWQEVTDGRTGDGESISYQFVVTTANCNFTYHYAVVLYSGPHTPGEQPSFTISMTAGGTAVACAAYQVDATTAETIGGFSTKDSVFWKPWSDVVVPLADYIGQTVNITFTTRGCIPKGCAGKHYAYAYISAECAPLNLAASSGFDCGGHNDTLRAPAGSATYSWTGPGIVGSNSGQTVIINQPGQYTVTMTTFGNTPCSFTMDTVITGTNPLAAFAATFACVGDPVTFTDNSTPNPGITSWQWNFGDGGTSGNASPTHIYAATGTYPVTLKITDGDCSADTTVNVTVVEPPVSTFTAVSPECEGSNSNIVYTGNAPNGYTFTWNFDGGTGIPVTGRGPLNISWQTPGIKTITLVVNLAGCYSLTDTQIVLVKPYPGMTLTPYTAICQGSAAVLNAANATVYTWAADPTLSNADSSTVVATPLVTTTYSVTGTNTNCTSIDSVTVGVFTYPTAYFTATGTACIGQNATVLYTGNGGTASSYNWNFNGGTATPDTGVGPLLVNWLTPGNHDITLNVTRSGCDSATTQVVNVFSKPPSPALTADTLTGCPGVVVCFTSTPVGNTIGYIWNFGDGDTSGTQNTCHVYAMGGTYTVNFQVALSAECIYDTTLSNLINVEPIPVAAFTPSATSIQAPQTLITFTNQSQNAVRYLWNLSVAGNDNTSVYNSTDFNTQYNFTQYGQYNATLYAYNQLGCPDSAVHGITVLPGQNYFIPNAFTPNGDGVNDDFYVELQEGATVLSFQIFDRWGEKVHDGLYPWDGNYKGKKAPEGVYVYRTNIHLVDMDQDVERQGSVTLMR